MAFNQILTKNNAFSIGQEMAEVVWNYEHHEVGLVKGDLTNNVPFLLSFEIPWVAMISSPFCPELSKQDRDLRTPEMGDPYLECPLNSRSW